MATDARGALDAAWGTIPQTRESAAGIGSFTRTRVERIVGLLVGFGCLALGAQAFLIALGPGEEDPGWALPLRLFVFLPLAAMIISAFVGRGTRWFAGAFALAFPIAMLLWPLATAGSDPAADGAPWVFYLMNVASSAALLAFQLPLQIVWTALMPLMYGFARLIQGGFAPDFWFSVGLNVSFALILGGIILVLAYVFRTVAANVDETRARAVDSYARAAAADAVEQERVSVAALMHDSVLAALISAERADSDRERTLAVSMAREALTRLANTERDAGMGSDEPVSLARLADLIDAAAAEIGASARLEREQQCPSSMIPGRVARAIVLAVTQALSNAMQHAAGAGLRIFIDGQVDPVHVQIRVQDAGPGFDPDKVPSDRLGISASIIARIAAVGGSASLASGEHGTTVTIDWAEAT